MSTGRTSAASERAQITRERVAGMPPVPSRTGAGAVTGRFAAAGWFPAVGRFPAAGWFPAVGWFHGAGQFDPAARTRRAEQRPYRITGRHLQVALGLLWLLDGGLQLQPFMFSGSFLTHVIEPSAQGQPGIVGTGLLQAAHVMSRHLAVYNGGAAAVQLLIGLGLLFPRTVKPALVISFGWALGVWAFGEGFGLLLTGAANPLTGAPGAVLLYVLAGLLAWPVDRPHRLDRPHRRSAASQGLLGDRGGRLAWAGLWCGFAVLSMQPANLAGGGISGALEAGGSVAPGSLAHLDTALGRASAGHGLPITVLLAALELGIGAAMLSNRWRNTAAVLGAAFGLAIWVTAEGTGGLTTGQATDPNSGLLLILLAAALYAPAVGRLRRGRSAERPSPAPDGRPEAGPAIQPRKEFHMRKGHPRTLVTAAVLALALSVSGFIVAGQTAQSSASTRAAATAVHFNAKELAFHDAMRQLWEEHVLWTRLFIVSDVFNSPDLAPTTTRLLANQVDIGNAVKPFYGSANGNQLTALLTTHILLAAKIIAAAKAGQAMAVKRLERAWYANANQIAAFLHGLNPKNWTLAGLRSMMHMHLSLTLTESVDQLTGNYTGSVQTFDAVETEILGMADTLSNGIIAQFPGMFS